MSKFIRGNTRAAKLSPEQVYEIRDKWANQGWTQARLCREYGVTVNTISRICSGQTHQHVPDATAPPTEDEVQASYRRLVAQLNADAAPMAKEIRAGQELDQLKEDGE